MTILLNFFRKAISVFTEASLNRGYFRLADFIRTEYRTNMSTHDIMELLKREGFDGTVRRITA